MTQIPTYPIILLPADKTSALALYNNKLYYSENGHLTDDWTNQTLLIIDPSAEIKERDWCLEKSYIDGKIQGQPFQKYSRQDCVKIIASTDKSITPNSWIDISKSMWIIDHYNKTGKMPDVQLEMEEYAVGNYGTSDGEPTIDSRIKLVNGSVIVKPIEEEVNWTDTSSKYDRIKPIEDRHDYSKRESQLAKAKLNIEGRESLNANWRTDNLSRNNKSTEKKD